MKTASYRLRIAFYLTAIVALTIMAYRQVRRDPFTTEFAEVLSLVESSYVEEVGRRELFEDAMRGMTARLDLHSTYLPPDSAKELEVVLEREYAGIGMKVEKRSLDGPLIVLSPFFDTPAYHAGMRAGDEVYAIDGTPTLGMPRNDAVMRIRGEAGEPVALRVRHPGEQQFQTVTIKRQPIALPSLIGDSRAEDGSWDFRLHQEPQITYVRLVSFGRSSAAEFKKILQEQTTLSLKGIILDLRDNAGGHLQAAVDICDLFLAEGEIVSTRDRHGQVQDQFEATPALAVPAEIPLVVLVNRYSASSSEIVAACLQDHRRAVIIGERTWGKGSVQKVFQLKHSGGVMKLTVATYWRPSGVNIQRPRESDEADVWGVTPEPEFVVELTDEELQQIWLQRRWRDVPLRATETTTTPPAEQSDATDDPVLQRAIDYLNVAPVAG